MLAACFEGSLGTAIIAYAILTAWFALRFPLASARGMMTVKQMTSPHYAHPGGGAIQTGIPLTEHGSTWTCLISLNAILAAFLGWHLTEWLANAPVTFESVLGYHLTFTVRNPLLWSHLGGYGLSAISHLAFCKGKYPEADIDPARPGKRLGRLTPAGWIHVVYFGEAVSILIQIYLFTNAVPAIQLCLLTAYTVGHVWLGNHFKNRIDKPHWFPSEYKFGAPDAWIPVLFVLAILVYATYVNVRRDGRSTTTSLLHPNYPIAWVRMVPVGIG